MFSGSLGEGGGALGEAGSTTSLLGFTVVLCCSGAVPVITPVFWKSDSSLS